MNLNRLYEILADTTMQLRKGDPVIEKQTGRLSVTEVFDMPHTDDVTGDHIVKVDCHFIIVAVDKIKAEQHRAELVALLNDYPYPDQLDGGPSYIALGAELGDQGAALSLMALGSVLGLWQVVTPATLGIYGAPADDLAGRGFVMTSGYKR